MHGLLLNNRYEVGKQIGQGGMGTVYQGTEVQTGKPVAIKMLKKPVQFDQPQTLERFKREAKLLQTLNHPNIVQLIDLVEHVDDHYLVMELVDGGSLETYLIENGPLSPEQVINLALELSDALARAHHLGVIHRDLKPANILVTTTGMPKLTDFGIAFASEMQRLTATDIILGTPAYLSPENINDMPPSVQGDIWAFGILLYELLTGQPPFRANRLEALMMAILTQPPAPDLVDVVPDIPPALADLIYMMLEKDPVRRIDSMRRIGSLLEDISRGHAPDVPAIVHQVSQQLRLQGDVFPVDSQERTPVAEKLLVVIFYSDIEKSTQRWETFKRAMGSAIRQHDKISQDVIGHYGGRILRHRGDGISAIFEGGDPLQCAIEMQKRFATADWGEIGELKIRIALAVGQVERHTYTSAIIGQDEEFFGTAMNRTARILDTGTGGQILMTPEVADILDIPPGAVLQDLGEHQLKDLPKRQKILGLVHPDLPYKDFPPLKSLSTASHNLPEQATSFIGREDDIATISQYLNDPDCRLITIVGPGGIGKTRLSLQVASHHLNQFEHGVFFVDLAPLSDPQDIIFMIAAAVGLQLDNSVDSLTGRMGHIDTAANDTHQRLAYYLSTRELLLVIDNFEHLLAGVDLIDVILAAAAKVKIIATSREALNIKWEWLYTLHGLTIPQNAETQHLNKYSAIQLFDDRARRVKPQFDIEAEKQAVIRICNLLEGMPLGIELATAWLRILNCSDLAAEIEQSLDILTNKQRMATDRHRSLQAVFDYSWRLLTPAEQQALMKLAIFHGAFDRTAARIIAGGSLPILSNLVDKSLLRFNDQGDYTLHELVRQFASQKLQESADVEAAVLDQHTEYYADRVEQLKDQVRGPQYLDAFSEIERHLDNIKAAWQRAISRGQAKHACQMIDTLLYYISRNGRTQVADEFFRGVYEQCYVEPADATPDEKLLIAHLMLIKEYYPFLKTEADPNSQTMLQSSIDMIEPLGNTCILAHSLRRQSIVAHQRNDYEKSLETIRQGLAVSEAINDPWLVMELTETWGVILLFEEGVPVARPKFQEARQMALQLQDTWKVVNIDALMMLLLHVEGDLRQARSLGQSFLKSPEQQGQISARIHVTSTLGRIEAALGNYDEALHFFEIVFESSRQHAAFDLERVDWRNYSLCLVHGQQAYDKASTFLKEAIQRAKTQLQGLNLFREYRVLAWIEVFRGDYNQAEHYLDKALQMIRQGEDSEKAYNYVCLSDISYRRGDYDAAYTHAQTAYTISVEKGSPFERLRFLIELSRVSIITGRAAEIIPVLHDFMDRYPAHLGAQEELPGRLGELYTAVDDLPMAANYFIEGLERLIDWQGPRPVIDTLIGTVDFLRKANFEDWVAAVLAIALHHRGSDEHSRFEARRLFTLYEETFTPEEITMIETGDDLPDLWQVADKVFEIMEAYQEAN